MAGKVLPLISIDGLLLVTRMAVRDLSPANVPADHCKDKELGTRSRIVLIRLLELHLCRGTRPYRVCYLSTSLAPARIECQLSHGRMSLFSSLTQVLDYGRSRAGIFDHLSFIPSLIIKSR